MYFYCRTEFVVRDCRTHQQAREAVMRLLPQDPDKDCTFVESWCLTEVQKAGGDLYIYDDNDAPAVQKQKWEARR